MKFNKIYSLLLAGSMLGVGYSCTDGYESEPVETYTIDFLFSETDSVGLRATRFLADMYETLLVNGHNRVGSDYLDAASGDAISINSENPDVYKLATGMYSSQSVVSSDMKWSVYWKYIRQANIFLANIDRVPFQQTYTNALGETHGLNEAMKTEVRFLRAYAYFEMVKRYGGVPLIGDRVFELGDDMEIPRNTFEECITYIVNELDAIRDNMRVFPSDASWMHAPTAEANMALKARVLLYAASPLF
ncbi:MAG: RagB/SusD family nutrient uptake outer membrane protein, partial [Muribaculaceae bacterium]|nr:RagB/SusD family nutrient uptake outer membrane protein [Muribaculaceae bacterium]